LIARVLGASRRKGRTNSTDELQISITSIEWPVRVLVAPILALSPEEFSAGFSLQRAADLP
jgi:hypothetical protein